MSVIHTEKITDYEINFDSEIKLYLIKFCNYIFYFYLLLTSYDALKIRQN